jgi:hypothetical protein
METKTPVKILEVHDLPGKEGVIIEIQGYCTVKFMTCLAKRV